MIVEAGLARLVAIDGLRVAGERNEERVAQLGIGAEGARHAVTVHVGHPDVAEHEIRFECAGRLESLEAAVGDRHVVTVHLERELEPVGDVLIVVDHQDAAPPAGRDRARPLL